MKGSSLDQSDAELVLGPFSQAEAVMFRKHLFAVEHCLSLFKVDIYVEWWVSWEQNVLETDNSSS